MDDLKDLKLDLTPGVLRNSADKSSGSEQGKTSDITIPFPEELQQKDNSKEK